MEAPQLDVHKIIADLKSHSVQMSWLNVVVIVLALLLTGAMYLHSARNYERVMARAETENEQYRKDLTTLEQQIRDDQKTIVQLQFQKNEIQTKIVYRDKAVAVKIETVMAPDRTAEQVSDDVVSAYKFPPLKLEGSVFSFSLPATQQFVATRLDRDRLSLDLEDTQKQLALETMGSAMLANDVQATQKQLESSKQVIADYRKVAKKSKFKSFLSTAQKVGLLVGGFYLGRII